MDDWLCLDYGKKRNILKQIRSCFMWLSCATLQNISKSKEAKCTDKTVSEKPITVSKYSKHKETKALAV